MAAADCFQAVISNPVFLIERPPVTGKYQPFTCDGLPEYKLYDTDGTVYSINFSEKWVWRGNSEQAESTSSRVSRGRASAR